MRTTYLPQPYKKEMEIFQNFSGGLNTISPPDGMLDNELTDIMNQDISERGSLKRRHGMTKIRTLPTGATQGYFRYYKTDGTFDEFHAIGGNLYKNGSSTASTITGLSSFQATRAVEAAQINGTLYIATGTKLLTYDGTTLQVVNPYLPTTMEMTYIGENVLADDPEGHLKDTVGSVESLDYVLPKPQYSGTMLWVSCRVYCTTVSGSTYEYAMQVRSTASKDNDWPAIDAGQWVSLNPTDNWLGANATQRSNGVVKYGRIGATGDYEIRISMRIAGTTSVIAECVTPFSIKQFYEDAKLDTSTVHQCNRVILQWDRLMMYGDPNNPALLYFSQVSNPEYFPALNTIEFDSPKREPITNIIHYRNNLVIFTKSSTQALTGTGPSDYKRTMLHTDLGCIAPYGAAVMKNGIGFVSLQGIYSLKTIGLTDDKATVERLDLKINNLYGKDENAFVQYTNRQLIITYPASKMRYRFYEDLGAWTKDYSTKFLFTGMWNIDGEIYGQYDGFFYKFDDTVFTDDDYTYDNYFETRNFNFGQPYHPKKLRELQVLVNPNNQQMVSTVIIYADEAAVIGTEDSFASVDANGNVIWNTSFEPNFMNQVGTTLGNWILGESAFGDTNYALQKLNLTGKCHRTRMRWFNQTPNENHFIGLAYVFKVRKP